VSHARRAAQACLVLLACLASSPARAAEPDASSLEMSGMLGPSVVFGDVANPAYPTSSFRRGGVFGEVGLAYRSRYFLAPFVSVGYATLASAKTQVPSGPWGAGGTLDQHLGMWVLAPGVTVDLWRFRLRYALGVAGVVQSFGSHGENHSSTQLVLAHQVGLGFNVLDSGRFRLDTEMRLVRAGGADVTFLTLGIVARGDLVRFGGRKK
jgi:hypothetical protein